jgi:peroxiredoxin
MRMKKNAIILIVLFGLVLQACASDKTAQKFVTSHTEIVGDHIISQTVDGAVYDSQKDLGTRVMLGFFDFRHRDALPMLKALKRLKKHEADYNLKIYGVSINFDEPEGLKKFLAKNKIDFPVILEGPALKIAGHFTIEHEVAVAVLDAKAKYFFGLKKYVFSHDNTGEDEFLGMVKDHLGIKVSQPMEPLYGYFPKAPEFVATTVEKKTFSLSRHRGHVVLIIFFSPTCPHCRHALTFLKEKLYPKFSAKGFDIVAISTAKVTQDNQKIFDQFKFPWPMIVDEHKKIRHQFSNNNSVPEIFVLDKELKVRSYFLGYSESREETFNILISALLGTGSLPTLSSEEYSGAETCQICHKKEYAEWSVTKHAEAWQQLMFKSEFDNPDCVQCHTLGFDQPEGYPVVTNKKTGKKTARVFSQFQNVQCENCHGLGGPHVTKDNPMSHKNIKATCVSCHTKKWSPDFSLEKALPFVNHSRSESIMKMPLSERMKLIQ